MARKKADPARKESTVLKRQRPVPEMCAGCARAKRSRCDVITEPEYFYKTRGTCFARVNARRAKEIEEELKAINGPRWRGTMT